jgi:predicted nucleotide-binding protein (sugar kinase/HSP70/actin superfamily)
MFNPLLGNLSKLKQEDLDNKIVELTKKYYIAMKLGNGSAAQQIAINLDAFKTELQQRQYRSLKEVNKNNQDNNLDNLINVD